ncbi:MAG: thiamine-phosphate kinase, partial [Candidatus Krumholzibacteriota bacterium]|nr:thiamine-phosphate kinase [Candidatus Krumholzibacteriota bacterium]
MIRAFKQMIDAVDIMPAGLVAGVGDDAAIIRGEGEDLVVTNDVMVEGSHFERAWHSGPTLGWRAAAVNLSDIAAMGARPRYAIVSLLIPDSARTYSAKSVERGVIEHFARYGAAVIGGNVAATAGPFVVDITAIGACPTGSAWRRAARAGDAIVVAGLLGEAAMGLALLRENPRSRGTLVTAFRKPVPRLDVSGLLAGRDSVRCAIDISDGFSTDLIRICRAGGVGCHVEAAALPLSRSLRTRCIVRGEDPLAWAMGGGEDYSLILGVAPGAAGKTCEAIRDTLGVSAAIVGEFTTSA